jgi:NAD(P)-dependent dehydrogenase (short-subunit alcohol dehydrogenase family)
MSHQLSARVVTLITGANRGLGFDLARKLVRLGGYHVMACARKWTEGPATQLRSELASATRNSSLKRGALSLIELDVASVESRYKLLDKIAAELGTEQRINLLCNNAGVYPDGWSADIFQTTMDTNAIGPLKLALELKGLYAEGAHIVSDNSVGLKHSSCNTRHDCRLMLQAASASSDSCVSRISPLSQVVRAWRSWRQRWYFKSAARWPESSSLHTRCPRRSCAAVLRF